MSVFYTILGIGIVLAGWSFIQGWLAEDDDDFD